MKISTMTMAFVTIMVHILLLLTAYTLQAHRLVAATGISNFLGASTFRYADEQAAAADEDRTMRVLIPNKYK